MFFLLLFFAFLLGNGATTQVPRVLQTPNVGVNDKELVSRAIALNVRTKNIFPMNLL